MSDTKEKTSRTEEQIQRGELQMALMKMVAEQNQEKFLEYDCDTDTATMSIISNGHFKEIEVIEGYYQTANLAMNRVAEDDRQLYQKEVEQCLKHPMSRVFDVRYLNEQGEKIWHRVYLVSIADEKGEVVKLSARFISIHKERIAQDMMRMKAERDSLSGVYNHMTYEKLCTQLAQEHSDGLLYLMIDIDNFKEVNDTRGHLAGDSIIRYVGSVLETATQSGGVAGRIGGDEFSVCFYDVRDKEHATANCVRIKDALKQSLEGIPFTVSIGVARSNGRKLSFAELYYEADEAVYFAKENGKNQIVFADEIELKKKKIIEESMQETSLVEEEIALDQKLEYHAVIHPATKKILYMNKPARRVLGITLEEAKQMYCYQLFKGRNTDCPICDLYSNQVRVLDEEESCGLAKYIPHGRFIVQSKYYVWKDEPARLVSFMDVNDAKHVENCFEAEIEAQDAISKCWSLILDSNTQDVDYTKVLKVLNDYYDADCCTIVTKNEDKYEELFEYHRNTGQGVVEGLRQSLKVNTLEECEVLLDEDGYMRPYHIEKKLEEYPELAKKLEKGFVHNTLGMKLARKEQFVGILMVINPRHHVHDNTIINHVGIFFTTDLLRKRLSDDKNYEATHDTLTRLWNRAYFGEWLERYGRLFNKKTYGVFTADIFRLKNVNKEFGYENGNNRIVALADMFRKVFGGYSVFRYDDDQMLAICHNTDKAAFEKLLNYARELMQELDFEVSYGYAWTAVDDIADMIREAENYLDIHRQRLEMENDSEEKLAKRIERDVIEEVKKGNFRMFLQPKVNVHTGKTVGAEALVRLYEEVRGFVSPAFFIPVLEEHNTIHLIDLFILSHAFQFQKAARDAGREIVPISVNFSKNTLMFPNLLEYIKTQCDEYGMPEKNIQIEITETISNMNHIEVNNIANALHNMGFSISMDDFGTKYSNMAVLTQFDFDTVKMDRSMILNVVEDKKNRKVLKHTIDMLKDLGMETIIEGVETAEQVEVVKELGCDVVQGFYYGRPEPEEKFYELYM